MSDQSKDNQASQSIYKQLPYRNLYLYISIALFCWLLLSAASLFWNLSNAKQHIHDMAKNSAIDHYNKDQAFRFWATGHGGVYVPVSQTTPPNPYLNHIEERDITTPSGRLLTLMNPAYMLRQLMEQYARMYNIQGKITSLDALNPKNAPDEWETKALQAFDEGAEEVLDFTTTKGEPTLRMMRPMLVTPGCLKCHAHQGYKVGDVRGGVGISVPLTPFLDSGKNAKKGLILTHLFTCFIGLMVIGSILLFSIKRIKERLLHEEEREQMHAALQSKNKELEQIVYVVSHDLRSPLVNIQGFSNEVSRSFGEINKIVGQGAGLPSKENWAHLPLLMNDIEEALPFIQTSTAKMDALLTGLLKISRLGRISLAVKSLDMNQLVADVVANFEFVTKEKNVDIQISDLPNCFGDREQINQVFSNLIGNAIKFLSPSKRGIINISGYQEKNKSIFCVEDNGIGIALEHQKKVFEIFHQLNPKIVPGEGLGLTIVRLILDRHQGTVLLDSTPGKGSKFIISLSNQDF